MKLVFLCCCIVVANALSITPRVHMAELHTEKCYVRTYDERKAKKKNCAACPVGKVGDSQTDGHDQFL